MAVAMRTGKDKEEMSEEEEEEDEEERHKKVCMSNIR
jgi:hypothetical protein